MSVYLRESSKLDSRAICLSDMKRKRRNISPLSLRIGKANCPGIEVENQEALGEKLDSSRIFNAESDLEGRLASRRESQSH